MSGPVHLFANWDKVEARIRSAKRLALFTDFDGTLVRIQRNHREVSLSVGVRKLLSYLSDAGVIVGIVSGRTAEDVRGRVGLNGIWYIGAHGFSLYVPGSQYAACLCDGAKDRMDAVKSALAGQLYGLRGICLEPKETTIAVHYRGAPPEDRAAAWRVVYGLLRRRPIRLLEGKQVWELLPNSPVSKWTAIRYALASERKRQKGARPLLIYLGDDVTDESVFERMTGISVAVGKRQKTAARFYLRSPAETRRFLEKLRNLVAARGNSNA
jgi:trehalose-phosphatase